MGSIGQSDHNQNRKLITSIYISFSNAYGKAMNIWGVFEDTMVTNSHAIKANKTLGSGSIVIALVWPTLEKEIKTT